LRLPAASASAQKDLDALRGSIEQNKISDAVDRYDVLCRVHGSELVGQPNNGELVTIRVCLDELADSGLLTAEYQRRFDDAAQREFQAASLDANSTAADFYAVARRYPLSSAAPLALAAAGDRAAAMGDWPTAAPMYQLAREAGWSPDPPHVQRIDELAQAQRQTVWSGPIPFDATWYGRSDASVAAKSFPMAAGGVVFISGASGVSAFKPDTGAVWSYPPAMQSSGGYRAMPFVNYQLAPGPVDSASNDCSAGVLSAQDSARVVVLLTARTDVARHCLQAIRASDGKLLWRTDIGDHGDKSLASLDFVPGTVVCGRYVYGMATDSDNGLFAIAFDIASGRELWKTPLPPLASAGQFAGPAGMTVDLDQLLICPNAGCVISLDRWTGDLRWINPYPSLGAMPDNGGQVGNWGVPPTARFDNRPYVTGDIAYFAPQDSETVFALNARSGDDLWNSTDYSHMTLIGAVDQFAILESDRIIAVQGGAANGPDVIRWSYSPRPESITGPAVVRGEVMFVPTTDKAAISVSTADGTEMDTPPAVRPPNFRAVLNTQAAEELLAPQTMGSFGFPRIQRPQPQW